jgi:hypothetical protein
MLLFRSLTLGLIGACLLLVATRPTVEIHRSCAMEPPMLAVAGHAHPARPVVDARGSTMRAAATVLPAVARPVTLPPAVVDVAPGVSASQLASLVRLEEGEHVTSIDDRAVAGDLDAGVKLAALDLGSRRYIDLGVEGPRGARRVLVLLH